MSFLLLGDYKSPGFNRSNLFLRRIANPPGRLAGLRKTTQLGLFNFRSIHIKSFLFHHSAVFQPFYTLFSLKNPFFIFKTLAISTKKRIFAAIYLFYITFTAYGNEIISQGRACPNVLPHARRTISHATPAPLDSQQP